MGSPDPTATDPFGGMGLWGRSWGSAFVIGLITLLLGVVVTIDPGSSLVLVAILVGAEFVASGVYRLARSLAGEGAHDRALSAVIGVVLVLVGLFLVRHLDLTLLLVSTLVGVFWIASGIAEVTAGLSLPRGSGGGWLVTTGLLGAVAGVVVLAYPVGTLLTLALLVGIWLIVRGIGQMVAAVAIRGRRGGG